MSLTKNLIFASLALFSTAAFGNVTYNVTAIPGLNGIGGPAQAFSLNNSGQVVGAHGTFGFSWTSSSGATALPTIGGRDLMAARSINNSGQIVGTASSFFGSTTDAFSGNSSATGVIGDLPGGAATANAQAINDLGEIVGSSESSLGREAYLFNGTTMQALGGLDSNNIMSSAFGINNNSVVVGETLTPTAVRAFRWDAANGMIDLGDLAGGSDRSSARDINNNGLIVGSSVASSGWRAFVYDNGNMMDIGDLSGGADYSSGEAVNNFGQVVGTSKDGSAIGDSAFIWDSSNGMQNMNSMLDANSSGWHLAFAYDINDSGHVVGLGYLNGQATAFYAEPVPEPATLTMLGLALAAIVRRKRKSTR